MNPMLQSFLATLLRHILSGAAGYLTTKGIVSENQAAEWVAAAVTAILAIGWSLWQKYSARSKFLTALMLPPGSTEDDVTTHIKNGNLTPTATTPTNTPPGVPKP